MILMSLWVSSNIFPGGLNVEQHILGMVIKICHNYCSLKCFIRVPMNMKINFFSHFFAFIQKNVFDAFFPHNLCVFISKMYL
jgi:hypothetical protein